MGEARLCLESILAHTGGAEYELRVIDDGSTDGTTEYLQALSRVTPRVVASVNPVPQGRVAAWNQGAASARGRILVWLGQDSLVAPGWLSRLTAHLADPVIGQVGPVTNRASNEAQIPATYRTCGEFAGFARSLDAGPPFDIRTLNTFCRAMRRDVYERVGVFDEQLEIDVFQEEDYASRVRTAGYRVVCASDVFVHNGGRSAVGHLTAAGIYGERFQQVRRAFEEKWAVRWHAYDHFNASEYDLLRRIRAAIVQFIPPEATVLMVSRGNEELLALAPHAWHFPRQADGTYAGHHPADSAEAIAHLEALRSRGAAYLLIPNSSSWWLTYYDGWRQHLEARYPAIVQDPRTCVVFDLRGSGS